MAGGAMNTYTSINSYVKRIANKNIITSHSTCKKGPLSRLMDLVLVILAIPMIAPLLLAIAILIKIDSRGKAFFSHTRIGKDGHSFQVLKFRTMVSNADMELKRFFMKHPELKAEWEATQKLRCDPRVTRVGRVLRRLSLDELPQLINILKGDMSLVGPRPIVDDEIAKYGDSFEYYKQIRPGLTGLWQVSGRNDTSYEKRVQLDEYYVRNWSFWLDIQILIRTVGVVLLRKGAY